MKYTFIEMVEDSLSAREARILRVNESSDEMSEFSEVAEKAKATLLVNLTTLSIDKLMAFINNDKNTQPWPVSEARLNDFGEMIKGDFTGKEIYEFFALAKARSEYIDGKNDDFDDKKESRLDELANKAKGIIIGKIEPLEATAIFGSGVESALGESN